MTPEPIATRRNVPVVMPQLAVTPIEEGDLGEVGKFLHDNLNGRIGAREWIRSVRYPWCESRPNFGVQLRDAARLCGVFLATYADRTIDGKTERFCNPHSWCVLSEYRRHGIQLILKLLKQPGYHFTMLTPNEKVAEIFRGLRFRDLDDRLVFFPNTPGLHAALPGRFSASDPIVVGPLLRGAARRDFELHSGIPWLNFVAFGRESDICLVAYKVSRWKRLPCARLIYVSDAGAFDRHVGLLQSHLLIRKGLLVSRIEMRFLNRAPRFAYRSRRTQAKLLLSPTLADSEILDLYSELVALDV